MKSLQKIILKFHQIFIILMYDVQELFLSNYLIGIPPRDLIPDERNQGCCRGSRRSQKRFREPQECFRATQGNLRGFKGCFRESQRGFQGVLEAFGGVHVGLGGVLGVPGEFQRVSPNTPENLWNHLLLGSTETPGNPRGLT